MGLWQQTAKKVSKMLQLKIRRTSKNRAQNPNPEMEKDPF
jgi:hypothetical protein